jgi:tRNA A-37 threonylcarbamoyl transferase component Bud32
LAPPPDIDLDGVRWWLGPGVDREAAGRLLRAATERLRSGAAVNLKTGRRKQLYPLDLRGGGTPDHLLKVNDYGLAAGLRRVFRTSKARHELRMTAQVAARGIPTVAPLAAGERRSGVRLRSCYLLIPILEDAVDLRRIWLEEELPPAERQSLVSAFGALTRRIHDAGVFQDDFAPNNFLVQRGLIPELFMIDFERAQLRRENGAAARRFMLAKIDRELAGAPVGDRMRFLHAYCAGERSEARRWWRAVEDFAPELARRDFARLMRKTTRFGRRYRRLAHGDWQGYARVDADPASSLEALPEERLPEGVVCVEPCDGRWRTRYGGVHRSEARRIWATANFLWARGGLCPRPLGAWQRGDQTVLLLERRPGARSLDHWPDSRQALRAIRVLLDRVLALAEIRGPLLPEGLVIESRDALAPRASLAAPHGVFPVERSSPERRKRVSELLRGLRTKTGEM